MLNRASWNYYLNPRFVLMLMIPGMIPRAVYCKNHFCEFSKYCSQSGVRVKVSIDYLVVLAYHSQELPRHLNSKLCVSMYLFVKDVNSFVKIFH